MSVMAEQIVLAARSWIGTRFHHQGRLKKTAYHKGGVDCLGLLIGIADELQLRDRQGNLLVFRDEAYYSHQPDTDYLRARLADSLTASALDTIAMGDVLLLRVDDRPQHLAIVGEGQAGFSIIHAYAPARKVVEHALDDYWRVRLEQAYRVFN